MIEPRLKHVGADAILAERAKMLGLYDSAKAQAADDPVKVEHGNVAEEIFRNYLRRFLPKKYGVAKGHILTRDLTYAGPLEEWDVIIYDILESPILYVRDDAGGTPRLGIPAQYVKAVVEVKATLTQSSVESVTQKLLKLEQFKRIPGNDRERRADFFPWGFFSWAVFFETATRNRADYIKCLNKLQPLGIHKFTQFEGAMVLRSQNDPHASGVISSMMTGQERPSILFEDERFEASDPELYKSSPELNAMFSFTVSSGFGINEFSAEMMNLVSRLNDGPMRDISGGKTDLGGFGHEPEGIERRSLWPRLTF